MGRGYCISHINDCFDAAINFRANLGKLALAQAFAMCHLFT